MAQCDLWFPDISLPVGFGQTRTATRLPVLVMVSGYARWLAARLLPSRGAEDLFAGWWQLLAQLGGVPRVLVWDGEGAVGQRRRRTTVLTQATHAFRGVLGAKVLICNPADPEAKGLVERANGYLETSFLPGRTFASPDDFNAQLADWLVLANRRQRRVLAARRPTGSTPTGLRCCHCRRWSRSLAGQACCDCRATTMCGWTATTTRPTRPRLAAVWRSAPTWTGST